MKRGLWLVGPLWATGISAYLMFSPMVKSVSVSRSLSREQGNIQTPAHYSSSSWRETQGLSAARPLLIPVLLAFLPFVGPSVRARRIIGVVSIILLAVFCALAAFSAGVYYMPSVGAMIAALVIEAYGGKKAKEAN